jgi:hypothetical protein
VSYVELEGTFDVLIGHDNVPIGAIMPGDCQSYVGKVLRLWKPDRSVKTLHLVTGAHYEEGRTTLSFVPRAA